MKIINYSFLPFLVLIILFQESFSCKIDTNLRFSNMIEYIKKDNEIKQILFKFYPEIICFYFPDTTTYSDWLVDTYMFIINDNNNSARHKWELSKKVDSINIERKKSDKTQKTNYHLKEKCKSEYNFTLFFKTDNVWSVVIAPKEIKPGLNRAFGYTFKFNSQDKIVAVQTGNIME